MEVVPVAPREDVINFGILPIALLAPALGEAPSALLALHRALAAKAAVDQDGERERGGRQGGLPTLIVAAGAPPRRGGRGAGRDAARGSLRRLCARGAPPRAALQQPAPPPLTPTPPPAGAPRHPHA
jgi:hypothetical protein